jgi:hypothetical protein
MQINTVLYKLLALNHVQAFKELRAITFRPHRKRAVLIMKVPLLRLFEQGSAVMAILLNRCVRTIGEV